MKVDLKGIYNDYEKEVLDTIEMMRQEYPVLNEIVTIIHLCEMNKNFENCFATSRLVPGKKIEWEIKLNPVAFSEPDIQGKFIEARYTAFYYSVEDIVAHELAHTLQIFFLFAKMKIDIKKYKYFWKRKYRKLVSRRAERYYKKYFKHFLKMFNLPYKAIQDYLGLYAYQNPMELLPECFNNYYHLKSVSPNFGKGERETYEFTKAVIEDYKKYVPKTI